VQSLVLCTLLCCVCVCLGVYANTLNNSRWIPLTNHNYIHEAHKSRLKSWIVWYNLTQNLLSSRFLFTTIKIKVHWAVMFPVVLYGCETWSLTLREEQRLRVFESRVLRKTSGPKRSEVTEEWRRLHNQELHDLCSSPNTSISLVIK